MTSLTILGRRWFNRGPGNTYFSATALVDGKPFGRIDYAYGYGTQYEHEMFAKLEREGAITGVEHYKHGGSESPWRWCERNGITYTTDVVDVPHKKDL